MRPEHGERSGQSSGPSFDAQLYDSRSASMQVKFIPARHGAVAKTAALAFDWLTAATDGDCPCT